MPVNVCFTFKTSWVHMALLEQQLTIRRKASSSHSVIHITIFHRSAFSNHRKSVVLMLHTHLTRKNTNKLKFTDGPLSAMCTESEDVRWFSSRTEKSAAMSSMALVHERFLASKISFFFFFTMHLHSTVVHTPVHRV